MSIVYKLTRLSLPLLLIAVASCGKHNPVRSRGVPPLEGTFVFYGYQRGFDTRPHLYVVNADGTGFHRLTTDSVATSEPRWSPDGTKIVCIRGDSAVVTVMNADGSNPIPLTHDFGDYSPSWSPDGKQIAYQAPNTEVWVINADGSNPHVLFSGYKGTTRYTWVLPTTFLGNDQSGILRIDVGDTLEKAVLYPILNQGLHGFYPRLFPTDSTIAFAWTGPPISSEGENIYTVKLDGTGLKQVTHVGDGAAFPVWSPDGSRIAYVGKGLYTITAVKRDGSDARPVVTLTSSNAFVGDWK